MKKPLLLLLMIFVAACGPISVEEYRGTEPVLELREFFDGRLAVYGILQDYNGRVTRRFTATIDASWQGDQGILEEQFHYDDGEQQSRTWQLVDLGEGRYSGTAGDVVGTASGAVAGAAFNWRYRLEVPYRGDTLRVNLDDWLFLVDERHIINRTDLRKFGFKVGELSLVIEKLETAPGVEDEVR